MTEDARGHGIGRALIEDLLALARDRGWSRMYWHTNVSNQTARRLYDGFAKADDFVRYRMILKLTDGWALLADAAAFVYSARTAKETCMADNKSPNSKRTEIILAWLGMAGAVGLLWWLVAE